MIVRQLCATAYSRIPAVRWVLRLSQISLGLDVSPDDHVAIVAPGEGVAPLASVLAVAARPVDQPGVLTRLVATHRGDRPAAPGAAPHPHHRRMSTPAQTQARGGVIENPAPSSKRIYAHAAAAVIPPAATHPSSTAQPPARRAQVPGEPATARTSRAGAATATPPPTSNPVRTSRRSTL